MSIRLDPRRLSALKLLAAEAGVRPGELVTSWVEERLDAARAGRPVAAAAAPAALAELSARVDDLARRLDEMAAGAPAAVAEPATAGEERPMPKRRGRPPKAKVADAPQPRAEGAQPGTRVPLHEEIIAVITERGPLTASEIAQAISERGRYAAPRSARPLDAATVNSRVSNPAYRARFARDGRRIGLAGDS
jgi:Tfp pilus assembly protein FimV